MLKFLEPKASRTSKLYLIKYFLSMMINGSESIPLFLYPIMYHNTLVGGLGGYFPSSKLRSESQDGTLDNLL